MTQQALMIYINDFKLMMVVSVAAMGLGFLLRKPPKSTGGGGHAVAEMD